MHTVQARKPKALSLSFQAAPLIFLSVLHAQGSGHDVHGPLEKLIAASSFMHIGSHVFGNVTL